MTPLCSVDTKVASDGRGLYIVNALDGVVLHTCLPDLEEVVRAGPTEKRNALAGVALTSLRTKKTFSLVDVSDFFFFQLRGGEGGVRGDRAGGGWFFIENPREGGAKYFFVGAEIPTKQHTIGDK